MKLKKFIDKKAKEDTIIGDVCRDIIRAHKTKPYDFNKSDEEILSKIRQDASRGGHVVLSAFTSFKKAYKKQLVSE